MNTKLIALLGSMAAAGALYLTSGVTAGEASHDGIRLKERAGAVLDVGTKRAVAYYLKDATTCQVSVIVSETYPEQIPYNLASVRFSTSLPGGTSTQIATSDGSGLRLSCATGAKSLAVENSEMIAWAPTN